MRVSLDSCVWEDVAKRATVEHELIAFAIKREIISAFICDAVFRIEAVPRKDRRSYFSAPFMEIVSPFDVVEVDGEKYIRIFSLGPSDNIHPGLPIEQRKPFYDALSLGIKLIRGLSWLGLPCPVELSDPAIYYKETKEQTSAREERQLVITEQIRKHGVGKAIFDDAGGWDGFGESKISNRKLREVCGEWADGELVASHYAYEIDALCTKDIASKTKVSVFNADNRKWLESDFGLNFFTVSDLVAWIQRHPRQAE